jgi:hypothetical protein
MGAMRVLVAEDHVILADRIAEGLRDAGLAVDVANDGSAALTQAGLTAYDVIVLDRDLGRRHPECCVADAELSDDVVSLARDMNDSGTEGCFVEGECFTRVSTHNSGWMLVTSSPGLGEAFTQPPPLLCRAARRRNHAAPELRRRGNRRSRGPHEYSPAASPGGIPGGPWQARRAWR